MTDTPEAVRLADELTKWARNYAGTTYEDDMATKSAAPTPPHADQKGQ